MKHRFNLLLVKETRAGEKRVALTPHDVKTLVEEGHSIYAEAGAGENAGFTDEMYRSSGAKIRSLSDQSIESYQKLFEGVNMVVRAKRPDRQREVLENQAIPNGITMIGALDPFEKGSPHIAEYAFQELKTYSIDQLQLAPEDPMNLLAAMSRIAGKLALQDAIQHAPKSPKTALIIGFGVIGQAALNEAMEQGLDTAVVITNTVQAEKVQSLGAKAVLLDKESSLQSQQDLVKDYILDADVVITSARKPNQLAPVLIPASTLELMKPGSVIVDMALSEGGNVEGSHHDATLTLGNDVIVTNMSGYPKMVPHEASVLWSEASKRFIQKLAKTEG